MENTEKINSFLEQIKQTPIEVDHVVDFEDAVFVTNGEQVKGSTLEDDIIELWSYAEENGTIYAWGIMQIDMSDKSLWNFELKETEPKNK